MPAALQKFQDPDFEDQNRIERQLLGLVECLVDFSPNLLDLTTNAEVQP
jgi:hypothetical protein